MAEFVSPLLNPLLRSYREESNLSAATRLMQVSGYDEDGYPVYRLVTVGDLVVTRSTGRAYRIVGFTMSGYDGEIIGKPYGLDADPFVVTVTFSEASDFDWLEEMQPEAVRHTNGLVSFE